MPQIPRPQINAANGKLADLLAISSLCYPPFFGGGGRGDRYEGGLFRSLRACLGVIACVCSVGGGVAQRRRREGKEGGWEGGRVEKATGVDCGVELGPGLQGCQEPTCGGRYGTCWMPSCLWYAFFTRCPLSVRHVPPFTARTSDQEHVERAT